MQLEPIQLQPLACDFKLRPIQEQVIQAIRGEYRAGNRRVVAHLATSGGKTILAGMLFRLILQKDPCAQCLFVVPRNVLADQTALEFEKHFGFDVSIIQGARTPDLSKHVLIATTQTMDRRLKSNKLHVYDAFNNLNIKIACIDEAHLQYKGNQTIIDIFDPICIGLTATPFSKGMGNLWDSMVRPSSMAELIEGGTISDYRVRSCKQIDRSKLSTSSTGEYTPASVETESKPIIGDVFDEWANSEDMKDRPFMGFATTIKTAIALSELFNSKGANTAYIHSKQSDEMVQQILESFKNGLYDGVFSVVKLQEGFDFPAVGAIIDCAPLAASKHDANIPNSPNRFVQRYGRGLRLHKSKDYCLVHCHAGNYAQFGPVEYIEELFPELDNGKPKKQKLTIEEKKKRARMECSNCGMMMSGGICSICGHAPKKPTQWLDGDNLDFVDGEMVELRKKISSNTRKKEKPTLNDRQKVWDSAMYQAKAMGRKIGAASHIYRDRFGVWPKGLERMPKGKSEWNMPASDFLALTR